MAARLAYDDLQAPDNLRADLEIIQTETRRMETLIRSARQLYRGQASASPSQLLDEVLLLARKEMQWHHLAWELAQDENASSLTLPPCPNLRLALLGLLQALVDAASAFPNALLRIALTAGEGKTVFRFQSTPPIAPALIDRKHLEAIACLLSACEATLSWSDAGPLVSLAHNPSPQSQEQP